MSTVKVKWIDGELFVGVDSYGHSIVTGSWPGQDPEWTALKPSDLLLLGVIACSGYDVVTILKKQREQLTDLEISCTGEQMPDPPYAFNKIHIDYKLAGRDLDESKVRRAIKLSEEKYCSVVATVRGVAEITSSYTIEERE
ncbi:MAG: OsmC family protein [Anaerolineae bacterium]